MTSRKDLPEFRLSIRVPYGDTDGQRRVHHANYLHYFERARVEMLRSLGRDYKSIEDEGLYLVVTQMNVRYHRPADFDDELTVTTRVTDLGRVRMRHAYAIHRGEDLLVDADSTIACINQQGKPARLPF
ncbi:MAG: thioesterase family protein [Planctomycetota bacterium]